jgi:hypothetical protein
MRVTRLIVGDDITLPLRVAINRHWPWQPRPTLRKEDSRPIDAKVSVHLEPSWPEKFINCQWCVSLWLSLAGALLAHASGFVPTWTETVWAWPGIAGAAGLLGMIWS